MLKSKIIKGCEAAVPNAPPPELHPSSARAPRELHSSSGRAPPKPRLKVFFWKKNRKIFPWISEAFLKKVIAWKNIVFCKMFENCFSENKIFENWPIAVRIWLFFDQLQRPITRMCCTQTKHLVPLNDSTRQDRWKET